MLYHFWFSFFIPIISILLLQVLFYAYNNIFLLCIFPPLNISIHIYRIKLWSMLTYNDIHRHKVDVLDGYMPKNDEKTVGCHESCRSSNCMDPTGDTARWGLPHQSFENACRETKVWAKVRKATSDLKPARIPPSGFVGLSHMHYEKGW